jgi:hypothetical protein
VIVALLIVAYILGVVLVAYSIGRHLGDDRMLHITFLWPVTLPLLALLYLIVYANNLGIKRYRN